MATRLLNGASDARADDSNASTGEAAATDRQRAEALYREGAQLLSAGSYSEAEARFQASYQLFNGRGTLLNLAICHEDLGRLASAWQEFKTVDGQASLAGDTARQAAAREHLSWIEPQLSYLSVALSEGARGSGVHVELDGAPLKSLGILFPIDPGRHQVRASAPGKKIWSVEVSLETGAARQSIVVPPLQDEVIVALEPRQVAPLSSRALAPGALPRADFSEAYIAGTATLVLGLGAVVSSFLYYDRRSSYYDAVTDEMSDPEQSARRASAERMAWINGSLIAGAGVGAAITGVLWYRAQHAKTQPPLANAWLAPLLLGSGAGLQTGARF